MAIRNGASGSDSLCGGCVDIAWRHVMVTQDEKGYKRTSRGGLSQAHKSDVKMCHPSEWHIHLRSMFDEAVLHICCSSACTLPVG